MVSDGPRSGPEDGNEPSGREVMTRRSRSPAAVGHSIACEPPSKAGQAQPHPDHRRAGRRQDLAGGPACRLLPSSWLSARVDLTRAMTALDFLQLIGHSLGLPLSDSLGAARARLHSILHDDDVDGTALAAGRR